MGTLALHKKSVWFEIHPTASSELLPQLAKCCDPSATLGMTLQKWEDDVRERLFVQSRGTRICGEPLAVGEDGFAAGGCEGRDWTEVL